MIDWDLTRYDKNEPYLSFNKNKSSLKDILIKCSQSGYFTGYSDTYRRLGILFKTNGQSDSAISAFTEAYKYSVKAKDPLSQASNLNQIASIYVEMKNIKKSIQYFRQAFDVYSQIPDHRGMSDATYNIAEMQFNEGQSDSAYFNCLQSLGYMRRWGDTGTVGYNYDLLSKIELPNKKLQKALIYSKQAIGLLKKDKDFTGLIPALNQLGKVYDRLNMPDSSIRCYHEAFGLARTLGYKTYLPETAASLAELYEVLGRQDSLVKYLKIRQTYTDSLNDEIAHRATTESLAKFDTEKKELALEAEKQTSANRKAMNTALLITAALLALFMLLMWRSFRQQKKIKQKESELNQANALLRGQDAERERIARELHDRVGSMLSTVKLHFTGMESQMSDLITQQSNTYQKALHLLDETYEEVRRISHDLDTGLLGRYGLRTAMLQLTQLISSANKVKVQYIDNNLPPELYQPFETELYRITQELLSNTIKYAGASEASIQISRNNGNLIYSYEDDGIGFSKPQLEQAKGLGYKNIEARVQKLNAQWHLDTSPGNGVNLIIEIPLAPNQHNHR